MIDFSGAYCSVLGRFDRACQPWYEGLISKEAVIAVGSTLLGVAVAGAVSYAAQRRATILQDRKDHQAKVVMVVHKTVLVVSDLQALLVPIEDGTLTRQQKRQAQMWQTVYRFNVTPSSPEYGASDMHAIHMLQDRVLAEDLIWLFENHRAICALAARYNELRALHGEHVKERWYMQNGELRLKHQDNDAIGEVYMANMEQTLQYFARELPHMINMAQKCQMRIGVASMRLYNTKSFLKLPPRDEEPPGSTPFPSGGE